MTVQAERGGIVILDQEFAVLVPVRIMAGGTLNLLQLVQTHLLLEGHRVTEFAIGGDQGVVVGERNRVVPRKVGANPAASQRHRAGRTAHLDWRGPAADHPEGNGAIVAAKAEFGIARGLAHRRLES